MLGNQTKSLNGRQLSNAAIIVREGDFDEEQQALRMRIVILLKVRGYGFDLLSVC